MSYDIYKSEFVKEKFWFIEIDLDYCDLEYGVAPCTASGSVKCFNTAKSCQDRPNYAPSLKTYRFCTKRSPVPAGLDAIPSLKGAPSISGAKLAVSGGIGVRGSINLTFEDHPFNDINVDKYVNERTYIPYETGTFWGKLRARNPYYNNRPLRAYSGYLVNGEFDINNFQVRSYVIENITPNRGSATVVGKDILKLADNDRALYPEKSTGELSSDITDIDTAVTLSPSGVGDLEYPSSGWVRVGDEVMGFTRVSDALTLTRGQYNTEADSHEEGDTVQICQYFNDRVDHIVYELLTTSSAAVDPSFIDTVAWGIEAEDNYPYFLEALITEPVGIKTLLGELGDSAPHFLHFDDREQLIKFTAVKQPPNNINVLNDQEHILPGLTVKDAPKMRLSDVIVHFGQKDPTKKMDEFNNYQQSYIRSDIASASPEEYGSRKIETIYSRWINNFNKTAAVELATRKGRRMGITPREVSFSLTSKDSDNWLGDNIGLNHPVLQGFTGEAESSIFQITSVKEAGDFKYTALEYLYSEPGGEDPEPGVNLIVLGGDANDINMRDVYDLLFPAPTASTVVKFIIDNNVSIGSTSTSTYSVDTGTWPVGMAPIRLLVRGYMQGKGGDSSPSGANGGSGGDAFILNHNVTIEDVTGIIGAGGGGGGGVRIPTSPAKTTGGGGGAGIVAGTPGATRSSGGAGVSLTFGEYEIVGGDGGGINEPGSVGTEDTTGVPPAILYSGGLPGIAINTNGYNLIIENGNSNILGDIL